MSKILIGNFKGPKGDTGAQGPVGPKGEQGIQGPVGPTGPVASVNGETGAIETGGAVNLLPNSWQFYFYGNDGGDVLTQEPGRVTMNRDGIISIWSTHTYSESDHGVFNDVAKIFSSELRNHILTVSLDVRVTGTVTKTINIYSRAIINAAETNIFPTSINHGDEGKWVRCSCRWAAPITDTELTYGLIGLGGEATAGTVIEYKNLAIHRGTVALDWSPAPEDYLGSFNAYNITNMHRNIFRGQSLGSTFTDAQKAAIAAGTWDDLYLGDYWTINNHTWRIADFDYWLGKGDTSCTKHHIVVVPDASLYAAQMHNTDSGEYEGGATANTTAGGYYNSDMRTTNLARAKTLIEADFGAGAILNHRILLTNAVKDGYPSGGSWFDSEVDLMNEMMVYGAYHLAPRGNGTIVPYNHTTEYTQLALFQAVPYYIMANRSWYWLRDVVSAVGFAAVGYDGSSSFTNSSRVGVVRPAVGIVGS